MRILRSRSRRFGFLRSVSFCIYKTQDFQFSLCFPETRCSASLCIQRTHQHQSQSRRLGFLCSASSYSFCGVWRVVTLIAIAIFIAIFSFAHNIFFYWRRFSQNILDAKIHILPQKTEKSSYPLSDSYFPMVREAGLEPAVFLLKTHGIPSFCQSSLPFSLPFF